ncbi:MAG: GNAT family N-acetyltransferase [Chitinophagales bacterium]|nr:GNAT family N-acetyltransferase [Chitinophagales bacterium]
MEYYEDILAGGIRIINTGFIHAVSLEALQRKVFPTLAEDELLHADQYIKHMEIFPEGQFVALYGEQVVGATTSIRYHYDIQNPEHHTFQEVMGGGWLTTHEKDGEWLYGIDVSVDPSFRKMGIAKALYRARQHTVRKFGLKGQITVGMLNGYGTLKNKMTVEEYYEKVRSGELFDPTVSVQQKIGFKIAGLIKEYLHDPACGNAGALIVLEAGIEL